MRDPWHPRRTPGWLRRTSPRRRASTGPRGSPLLRCRACAGVTELSPVARKAASARCPHCGASLRWNCPVCRRTPWVDEPQCPCGFRMAMREPVLRHFDAAQQSFRALDLTGALEHLERSLELAPGFARARNAIATVRQRQAELARVKLAYETARAGGKLSAARAAIEAWSRLVDPQSPEIQAALGELSPMLRRALALAARAQKLERSDPSAARNLYRQSLDIAADLPDALAGLARTPPDPPTAMDAQVLGDRIRLIWTPPPPDGLGPLTFAVVRKRNGVLQHPADGTRIAEVGTCEFDDTLLTPGETVGYAVLSRRGGVDSLGAISLGPFVFLADVKDVRVEVRDHEAELSWSPPRGIAEIRVVRKRDAPPANPRDGDRIASALDHTLDRDIDPGQDHYYGIYAIYRMPDGRLYPSPGIVVAARPQLAILAPDAPRLLQEATGRVRIDWIEPARGSIRILRTPYPLPLPAGSRLTAADAGALDGHWIEPAGPDRAFDPDPPRVGLSYYTPVAGCGDSWTVGHGTILSRVPDPSELRATRAGSGLGSPPGGIRVTLRWRWDAEATAAMVVARQGALPQGPGDPLAITANVPRTDYDRQDCWTFSLPTVTIRGPVAPAPGGNGAITEPMPSGGGPMAHPGLQRRRGGRRPHALAGPGAVGGHDPARPSHGSHRELSPGTALTANSRPPLVTHVPDRAGRRDVAPHGRGGPPAYRPALRGRRGNCRPLACGPERVPMLHPAPFNLAGHGVRVFPDPGVKPDEQIPIRFQHPETGATRVWRPLRRSAVGNSPENTCNAETESYEPEAPASAFRRGPSMHERTLRARMATILLVGTRIPAGRLSEGRPR